jgi:hypothetical protein
MHQYIRFNILMAMKYSSDIPWRNTPEEEDEQVKEDKQLRW